MIGQTVRDLDEIHDYLSSIGQSDWHSKGAHSDAESLTELYGRLCYRSWAPGKGSGDPDLNPNIVKIRETNREYLKHVIEVGHGSLLEHCVSNWIFKDVSRVLTHELVRHRAGTAFSQESMRFVRLTDLGLWLPSCIQSNPELVKLFETTFESLEKLQLELARVMDMDGQSSFDKKKELTSAMRRVAPDGLATTIGVSFNMRALRHIIEMRTAKGAEEEIRVVFDMVAQRALKEWPNLFMDFKRNEFGEWVPEHSKI